MADKKTSKKTDNDDLNEMKFEYALGELESLIEQMESEDLPLDDLVTSYERGIGLWKLCQDRLDRARLKVEAISRRSTEDEPDLEEFEGAAGVDAPPVVPAKVKPVELNPDDEIKLF